MRRTLRLFAPANADVEFRSIYRIRHWIGRDQVRITRQRLLGHDFGDPARARPSVASPPLHCNLLTRRNKIGVMEGSRPVPYTR